MTKSAFSAQALTAGLFLGPKPGARISRSELADHRDPAPIRTGGFLNNEINVKPIANAPRPNRVESDTAGKAQSGAAAKQLELVSVRSADIDQDAVVKTPARLILNVAKSVDLSREKAAPATGLSGAERALTRPARGLFGRARLLTSKIASRPRFGHAA